MVLVANGLSYERNKKQLFAQLSFQLHAGEAMHVLGSNGAGKTSLLKILAGLLSPSSGCTLWNNVPIYNSPSFKKNLLYIGHRLGMKSVLTPFENLYLFIVRRGLEVDDSHSLMQIKQLVKKKITYVLELLDLTACLTSLTNSLSEGEQRRLVLAKLLLVKANCWILDEPFTALDSKGINFVSALIAEQLNRGGIVIFASHQQLYLPKIKMRKVFLGDSRD